MVGGGVSTFVKAEQDEKKIEHPSDKERSHEPVSEFENVVYLVSMLGGVRWLTEELIDQSEPTHTSPNLPRLVPDAVVSACDRDARF